MAASCSPAELLRDRYSTLSPGHQQLAEFILSRPHDAALMTLEKLAQAGGVSVATANRLAGKLGLSGHPELKEILRTELKNALQPAANESIDAIRIGGPARAAAWSRSLDDDVRRIAAIHGDSGFAKACDLIAKARRLFLVGFGSSAFIAQYAAFNFATLRDDCHAVTDSSGTEGAFRQIMGAGSEDVAIQLAFARYTEAGTAAARALNSVGTSMILISDAADTPPSEFSAVDFLVSRKSGFVLTGGGAGAVAVVEALIHGTTLAIGIDEVERRAAQVTSMLGHVLVEDEKS